MHIMCDCVEPWTMIWPLFSVYIQIFINVWVFLLWQEEKASHSENLRDLNLAVSVCAQKKRTLSHDNVPAKRDSGGRLKSNRNRAEISAGLGVSFGPHLLPVRCQQDEVKKTVPNDGEINTSATPREGCAVWSETLVGTKPTGSQQGKHACDCAAQDHGPSEKAPGLTWITTNDLLDCLVHPDIISRVTELLLERHQGELSFSPAKDSEGTAPNQGCEKKN